MKRIMSHAAGYIVWELLLFILTLAAAFALTVVFGDSENMWQPAYFIAAAILLSAVWIVWRWKKHKNRRNNPAQ